MEPLENGLDARQSREKLEITQRQMADMLGISTRHLGRQEASDHLEPIVALAIECLLRRRATSHQTAVSPEERAERKFRERQRLRELEQAAGVGRQTTSPEARAKLALDYKEARRQLGLLRGRNRQRIADRPLIAALHRQLKGLLARSDVDGYRMAINLSDQVPGVDKHVYLMIYTDAARQGSLPDDSPLVTLPLEIEP